MEVNNSPKMDQMLLNTAAPAQQGQNARAAKDPDRADFDTMVSQRRAAGKKDAPKTAKQPEKPEQPAAEPQDGANIPADGQYAVAATMLLQAQPDMRITPMEEPAADAAALVPEAVQEIGTEEPAAQPEQIDAQEITAAPETAEQVTDAPEAPKAQNEVRTEAPRQEQPVERQSEAPAVEAKADAPEAPRGGQEAERPAEPAQVQETRPERTAETPRFVRSTERTETEEEPVSEQAVQSEPLFTRVDTAPVKVAEAARPVPLEAEDGVEQLGRELGEVMVNRADANRVEITLTPESLGKLTVEITRGANGALNVVLHPTSERAANLLERSTGSLQTLLAASTRNETQVLVRPGAEQQQTLDPNGQNRQDQQQQQQQRQNGHREQRSAEDFLQQLRLGLVDADET